MSEEHYLGNPLLKKAYTRQDLTQEQVIELGRCSVDPVYFAKNYMRIVTLDHGLQPFATYPFQERMLQSFQSNRFNICLLPRQSGKSTTVVAFLLQYAIFNDNINIAVLANKASTARDILNRLQTGYENLPKWMQQGVCSWNKGSMELENGSKIIAASTSASSVRGGTYNIIFLDEFAFVPQQVADNFMSSVYPTITSGKETKVIIVSCVTKDTYLLTDRGYRRIEALVDKNKTGAYITQRYTVRGNNEFYSSNIVVNQGKVTTNIIKTRYEELECSETHYLWSFKDGKYDYVRSRDLSVGDYVAVKYNQQIFGNDDYVGFKPNKGKSHNTFSCDYVNPDIAYFIGLYVSEGYARKINNENGVLKGGQTVITCGDDISEYLSKLNVTFRKADKFHYIINSKQLIEFISVLGFDVTKKAKEKILSDKVLSWSKHNITALLRGMFDGDGCIDTRGRISYSSTSRELIRQVQLLLANLGILGSIYKNITKPTKKVRVCSTVYRIEITGEYATKYFNEVGFSLKRKSDRRNFLTTSFRMGCNSDIVPDSYEIIKKEAGIVGRGKKFKNYSRKFLLENKAKFYESANDELKKFFDDNVGENLIWLKITNIEKSENEVFDVSLPDIEGDKWAHSVLYNNFLGHQTPNGMNQFYKLWDDAIKQKNKYIPTRVYWQDVPGRDERFKHETIANMGQSRWDAEFECDFLGSSDTLISGSKLSNLVTEAPIRTKDLLDVYEEPVPGKIYVITVDVAEGVELDYSAFVVFDTTQIPYKIVAKYRNNDIPSIRYPDVIEPVGRAYNDAFVLCEVNNDSQVAYILHTEYGYPNVIQTKTLGRGGQVAGQNLAGKGVKYGIKMSKPVKRTGCLNLKTFIEEDKLIFNDRDIIGELTTFVSRYNSFSAEEGKNDDLVVCLVLFAWICTQEYFKEMTETDIRKKFREEHEQELEENDSTPFGFISSADSIPNEIAELYDNYLGAERDADGNLWHTSDNDHSYFWNYNY
jgi:intein/homing endonuclease